MKSKILIFSIFICTLGMFPIKTKSCTTFCIKDKNGQIYFGRNLDWETGVGQIQINQRDIQKTSFISIPEKMYTWTSKYGSITFNQIGREFPYGGMNEAGLIIENMMLGISVYPSLDKRYGLEELQWIQYQLDVSATVDDVIKSDNLVRISYTSLAPLHFLVSDAKGNVAVIEYIKGKMIIHKGKELKFPVLANDTYHNSLKYYYKLKETGRIKIHNINNSISSMNRFVKAACMVSDYDKSNNNIIDYSFSVLDSVTIRGTQWSIVYNPDKKEIYYRTKKNRNIKKLEISNFNFSNTTKRLWLDIDENSNKIGDFKEFDAEANYKLIESAFDIDFLRDVPYKREFAMYPDNINCKTQIKLKKSAFGEIVKAIIRSPLIFPKTKIRNILKSDDEFFYEENKMFNGVRDLTNFRTSYAIKCGELFCEKYPQSSKLQFILFNIYLKKGKTVFAYDYLKKGEKINRNENKKIPAYYQLRFLMSISNYEKSKSEIISLQNNENEYSFSESDINYLGYELIKEKRFVDAIEIFKINVVKFPNSANVYDSLGEAYMKVGNKELAILNYEKALKINPQIPSATQALKQLKNSL